MNFAQLKQRAAFLAQQAGSDSIVPQPDWGPLVNRGVQDFSWDTEYNTEDLSFTSVLNQAAYTLDSSGSPRLYKSIKRMAYGTNTTTPQTIVETSESDMDKADPLWWQRPAGTVVWFLFTEPNVIRLVPPPIASGDTIMVSGTREALALSVETDVPGFPGTWHEAVALRAAVLHCEVWVKDDGAAKVQLYREQYGGMVRACELFLAGNRYARLQRTVQRPWRRRTFNSLSGRGFTTPY